MASAQVLKSALESAGFDVRLADEQAASAAPHLVDAMGGIRIMVRAERLSAAHAFLQEDAARSLDAEDDFPPASEGDLLTDRAVRATIVGMLLFVFLPYALVLAVRALLKGGLSRTSRGRLVFVFALAPAWSAFATVMAVALLGGTAPALTPEAILQQCEESSGESCYEAATLGRSSSAPLPMDVVSRLVVKACEKGVREACNDFLCTDCPRERGR